MLSVWPFMEKIPVSILIPIRNEEANLPRCLASVAWADEIVVVDNASQDGTADVARAVGVLLNADAAAIGRSRVTADGAILRRGDEQRRGEQPDGRANPIEHAVAADVGQPELEQPECDQDQRDECDQRADAENGHQVHPSTGRAALIVLGERPPEQPPGGSADNQCAHPTEKQGAQAVVGQRSADGGQDRVHDHTDR